METLTRLLAGALMASWLICASEAGAECLVPPPIVAGSENPADSAAGMTQTDRLGRVVAPVLVNGQGPFRFIVDTGANRSALSPHLAERLGLVSTGFGEVHSIDSVSTAPMVELQSLAYGALPLPTQTLPILDSSRVLAGESGLLGVDGMQGRRLRMDFRRRCIEITPSRTARRLQGWTTVRGELRFGHLVVIPGRISNVDINVLIDTGSDGSLGNLALRDALVRLQISEPIVDPNRAYTAGRPLVFDRAILVPRLDLDDIEIRNITAYIGDFHVFSLWGFQNEPTLLVGMDVIGQTQGIAIDYGRATVHFQLPRRMRSF
jgi:predicted aspartyl protease